MAHHTDFWPSGRQKQLDLCKKWVTKFTSESKSKGEDGKAQKCWQAWGIPAEVFAAFAEAYSRAVSALEAVVLSGSRSGPLNTACRDAFTALEKIAREIRQKYLTSPPLLPEEMAEMGIPERDTTRNPPQLPRFWPLLRVTHPNPGIVDFLLSAPSGIDQDVSGFDRFVRIGILAPDGKVNQMSPNARMYITETPRLPYQLPEMFKANRRREEKVFSALEAGCKLFISVAYMNSKGELGPWSPITMVIIT